jgi:hypothetical protein
MELRPDFAFGSHTPVIRTPRLSLAQTSVQLGLLEGLQGSWAGTGFNAIWRPFRPSHGDPPTQDRFLELNLTDENLQFDVIHGPIPNRGLLQRDITMFGLWYLQQIKDTFLKDPADPTKPLGLHLEPGIWATVEPTAHPEVGPTVVRMASIPHGTTVIAQGTATQISEQQPVIPEINITTFQIGNPISTFSFPESNLSVTTPFRQLSHPTNITQEMVDNPNSVLAAALPKNIINTVVIEISSGPCTPVLGGGVANTAFLQGSPDEGPNAQTALVRATFWIETVGGASGAPNSEFLQYSQTVLLNFRGLSWPHVSVATLQKVPQPQQPAQSTALSATA